MGTTTLEHVKSIMADATTTTIPNLDSKDTEAGAGNWVLSDWSACSESCTYGKRVRHLNCTKSVCEDPASKQTITQECVDYTLCPLYTLCPFPGGVNKPWEYLPDMDCRTQQWSILVLSFLCCCPCTCCVCCYLRRRP